MAKSREYSRGLSRRLAKPMDPVVFQSLIWPSDGEKARWASDGREIKVNERKQ